MDYKHPRKTVHSGPEQQGATRLRRYMEGQGWYVKKFTGGKYQSGVPDLYCYHPRFGHRWVETKAPGGKLRDSQIQEFTRMTKFGDKVYVLENEIHYFRLFEEKGNWMNYVRI